MALIAVIVIYLIVAYNGLIRRRNQIENAWSQIDVQLKRRHRPRSRTWSRRSRATPPTSKARSTPSIQARNAAIARADARTARPRPTTSSPAPCASCSPSARRTPTSRPTRTSSPLQEELTATEGRVAYARQFYNDSVLDYNNKLQPFPAVVLRQAA